MQQEQLEELRKSEPPQLRTCWCYFKKFEEGEIQ